MSKPSWNALNLIGQVYGRLTVLRRTPRVGIRYWICLCECGSEKAVRQDHLLRGETMSCGCRLREIYQSGGPNPKHRDKNSAEYRTWSGIKSRCLNPNRSSFERYGAKGVTICAEWVNDYSAFLHDMGRRPSHCTSIDRIDNSKGYQPGNCRWATSFTQGRNIRSVKLSLEKAQVIRQELREGISAKVLAAKYGVSLSVIYNVKHGQIWNPENV